MRGRRETRLDSQRALLVFALAVVSFHHLPTIDLLRLGVLFDLATPFAVVGAAALVLLAARPTAATLAVAFVAAVLYVDGHGIHLAANAIHGADPTGKAGDRAYFWDERFGHIEWHLGWFALILAFCLAERTLPARTWRLREAVGVAALLGFTLFTNTVEGQTWPLMLAAGSGLGVWAFLSRRPLLVQCAAAFGVAAALVGVWALWQGGVPEFTDVWDL